MNHDNLKESARSTARLMEGGGDAVVIESIQEILKRTPGSQNKVLNVRDRLDYSETGQLIMVLIPVHG